MARPTEDFDALVIGGGPGGATTALLLAQGGWSVAVVERQRFPRRKVCGEYLSAANWPLLEALGIAESFDRCSGPEIRRVGLFAGQAFVGADLPLPQSSPAIRWGRALSRERLDAMLLDRAARCGAEVLQPWRAVELRSPVELRSAVGLRSGVGLPRGGDRFVCRCTCQESGECRELRAPIVIAAHGSWLPGGLPTEGPPRAKRAGDLFGFKASFHEASLDEELMPLLTFADGYGGLVHCDGGRTGLSCCIRRDRLARLNRKAGESAGQAVLAYLFEECSVLRSTLGRATCEAPWLSAGPIRPGIRAAYRDGLFQVGNAAGEAHPVVAEGISMAMQSGWLLAERLLQSGDARLSRAARDRCGRAYARDWRRAFAPRIRAAAGIAHWAMHPAAVRASLPLLRNFPRLLTWGAVCSGKTSSPWRRTIDCQRKGCRWL